LSHPERACYLLGAEDYGLPAEIIARCEFAVRIPGAAYCLNLASAATIMMYDRISKRGTRVLGPPKDECPLSLPGSRAPVGGPSPADAVRRPVRLELGPAGA
jgi:hypothetical protein